jgi:hypothetical protein
MIGGRVCLNSRELRIDLEILAMASTSLDASPSEPLLSADEEDFDALRDQYVGKNDGKSGFRGLLASKYVVGCALFSSIGGLIFGYGMPSRTSLF